MARFRDLLSNRNFFFLWLGQVISNFGDRLNQMALVALVYQRTPGSEVALAKLISFTIIPVFLIGPLAGVWVDRLDRRRVMIMSDILRGLLVLMIPALILSNQMGIIYLVIFIVFSISRFFIPSKMALIPDLVSKDKLLLANTMQDTTHMIGNVVGLVVAGVIVNIKFIGAIGGFYIDAATFFISAILIGMIIHNSLHVGLDEDLRAAREALEKSIKRSVVREACDGLKYLFSYKDMRFVVFTLFLLLAGIGTLSCVSIVFVQKAFGTATRDLGFLGMFLVAGLFLGTIIYGRFGQKVPRKSAVLLSFIGSGLSVILFAIIVRNSPNLFTAGLLASALGAAISPVMTAINTLAHETIPADARGRIFSSLEAVIHLSFAVFMLVAAYAAKYVDRLWILIATGIAFLFVGASGLAFRARAKT